MKISIDLREPDRDGKKAIRLIYYAGSYIDPETKKRKHKRSRESLSLFLYDNPRTPAQRLHNRETQRAVEAIRAKRLYDHETGKHQLDSGNALKSSFFDYFQKVTNQKALDTSKSNHSIWVSTLKHLKQYYQLPDLTFGEVNQSFMEGFRHYLMHEARTKSDSALSRNTQYTYFNKLRACLNQAEEKGILKDNPTRRVKCIKAENNKRTHLTKDELIAMAHAECRYDVLKRAFLFSCCTGLRWSDINKLTWAEVEPFYDSYRIIFHQKKTNDLQYLDLSSMAMQLMGTRQESSARVFRGLKYSSWHNMELLRWAMKAGITKQVTFHAARHTFAVIQLTNGVDIYTLSRLLGHSELRTTEIYADIIESRRRDAMLSFPDILPLPQGKD
ncbi:integrase [Oceanisphaera marina]|uniref:Integrase n=1 Tax=Oceanisphaera marina TaxID=2017550 RepID=A0ABQ1IVX5_9GAMM|nr:site-specific integrase [Oceanisphaera marina]GGB52326.1 integrase [Oceanisphaera marina]